MAVLYGHLDVVKWLTQNGYVWGFGFGMDTAAYLSIVILGWLVVIHPSIHSSVHQPIYPSNHPYIYSSIHPTIRPSTHQSILPSIHPLIHQPTYLPYSVGCSVACLGLLVRWLKSELVHFVRCVYTVALLPFGRCMAVVLNNCHYTSSPLPRAQAFVHPFGNYEADECAPLCCHKWPQICG